MKRHEKRAECASQHDRDRHPDEIAADRDPDDAGRHRGQMGVAGKPDRPQMPDFAVPFGDRNVIDRALFNEPVAE
jgi:hypothetical protein